MWVRETGKDWETDVTVSSSGFTKESICFYSSVCNCVHERLMEFQPHLQRSLKFTVIGMHTQTHSRGYRDKDKVWVMKAHDNSLHDIFPLYLSFLPHTQYTLIVTHTPFSYSVTLCWSAMLRPAHISFTIRFHKSVSVFKLASNASFRPRTRSFRLGIRRSRKGAEDTFTSYREKQDGALMEYTCSFQVPIESILNGLLSHL